ncbi:MAG: nucleotide exchange factor GrpE [Desulfobacteraceae bacterium 4572_130]|nr:MAG: nucleotide exchange factor GrpE [Desulfobacteraceae bacterium 4572_130]
MVFCKFNTIKIGLSKERKLDTKEEPKGIKSKETFKENIHKQEKSCGESNKSEKKSCKKDENKSDQKVEKFEQELKISEDKLLRLSAEFENYKKRSTREINDFRKFANESILKQLLIVVDNLERAIDSSTEKKADKNSILEGVQITHKEILKLFKTFNVNLIKANGKIFDPALHQAIVHEKSDEYPDNTVITELQKGYLVHDRLLRPSMVIVSKKIIKEKETK